jgi:membrane protein
VPVAEQQSVLERGFLFYVLYATRPSLGQPFGRIGRPAPYADAGYSRARQRKLDSMLPQRSSRLQQRSSRRNSAWRILLWLIAGAIAYRALARRWIAAAGRRETPSGADGRTGAFGRTRSTDEPLHLRDERASEPCRGRRATAPWKIPLAGWKDILWRTYRQVDEDRLLALAAGVVFYVLLASFPAITALVSLYGLFARPSTISDHLSVAAGLLPAGAFDIFQEQVNRLVAKGEANLSAGFVFGLGFALWSTNAGMKAIIDALNVVYDEKEKRSFVTLTLVSLAFTVAGLLALLLAIGAVVVFPLVLDYVGLGRTSEVLLDIVRWLVLVFLIIIGLAVLYRFGPSRTEAKWQWLSMGSVFAAVAWLSSSALLSWYLANFANYDATYGSLGAAIGLMMWMWVSAIVILFGAELNSEIEHQTARDSTINGEKPLGTRGAVMADTVGQSRQ